MSEQILVAAAQRGQAAAFDALCQPHTHKLFRSTFRITRNREDAEDALQDALLSAFVHLKNFDGRSSFATWLTRITINAALMKIRKNRAAREISMDWTADDGEKWQRYEPADYHPDPEEHCVLQERDRMVRRAVSSLRPAIRKAVEIRQLQECSMKETAEILGVSLPAAKGRLFHARAALRKKFRFRNTGLARLRRTA
jgi:RNA polymerase sigma factor (sigma-70 family)